MLNIRVSLILLLLCGSFASSGYADWLARFHTPYGDMDVQLFSQDKPVTAYNFARYVRTGQYNNMFLHRCIPNFIIQGGGFRVLTPNDASVVSANATYFVNSYGKITNEYSVGRTFSNIYGTLAMAKVGGDPNSATSQWFFNLADNSANLDNQNGGFTVFGRVIGGTNAMEQFNHLPSNSGTIIDASAWYAAFSTLPVKNTITGLPFYTDLFYPSIEILQATLSFDGFGGRVVSWTSVSNKLNKVESSDIWPPVWTNKYSITGTGGTQSYTDNEGSVSRRFYRVRVDY